jgi:hypothetical protein
MEVGTSPPFDAAFLNEHGRQDVDLIRAGRAHNYKHGGPVTGRDITAIIGWPPTGETYARIHGGRLVLVVPGPDGPMWETQDGLHAWVPTWDQVRVWVEAHGWTTAVESMAAHMGASSPATRKKAGKDWRQASDNETAEEWLERHGDYIRKLPDRFKQGAGDLVTAVLGGIVAWRIIEWWARR